METYEVEVSSIINSRADVIYSILADYHTHHPKILPVKYFKSLRVKQGGIGEGTVIQVEMQIFGKKQNLRMVVSEPQPGVLQEQDDKAGITTWFRVEATSNSTSKVSIRTSWRTKGGIQGLVEKLVNPLICQSIYKKQLDVLNSYAAMQF